MSARSRPARHRATPFALIAAPAFVATWSGWVGLGQKAGFGPVNLLPGIGEGWTINTAITLPIGIEAYAAYALGVWLSSRRMSRRTRRFAMISGVLSLVLGAFGQVAYHLLETYGHAIAPWQIVVGVACLPIAVVGMTAALVHLQRSDADAEPVAEPTVETAEFEVGIDVQAPPAPAFPAGVLPPSRDQTDVPPPVPPVQDEQQDIEPQPSPAEPSSEVVPITRSADETRVREAIAAYRKANRDEWPSASWLKSRLGGGHARHSKILAKVQKEEASSQQTDGTSSREATG